MKADVSRVTYGPKLLLAAAAIVVLIVLALIPSYVGLYQTQLLTYGLIAAIAALGFNLLLGYTGLLSFGHSAFFGIGAYSVAFLLRDAGIHSMELYILIGLPIAAVASALFGYICVRHTRIFFGILTLALSQVLYSLAYKFFWITGGTDGLRVARPSLLAGMVTFTGRDAFQRFIHGYYYYVLAVFVICVVVMWVIVHSPFGKALQAIRDNETRAAFLGLRIPRFRWVAFLISGTFTGLAGILWVPLNGLTTPEVLYWTFSGEIVFTALLGGFRNFTGPIVGGIVFTYLKTYAVATTEYWQLLLGQVLVALVIILPTGIVGTLANPVATYRAFVSTSVDMLLRGAGILLILVSFNWWLIFYSGAGDIRSVVECMFYTTAPCLATIAPVELAGHLAYRPFLMWIGLASLAAGLIIRFREWQVQTGIQTNPTRPSDESRVTPV